MKRARREPPSAQERETVKIEGQYSPGWLRSRFMRAVWPRPGVAPCGRVRCKICEPRHE
jgi:hypothetical protein